MNENRHAVVAGGIIFVCVMTALIGVMWLSRSGVFKNDYPVKVYFSNVKGLNSGDGVKVDGSNMGQVADIQLQEEGAVVVVSLKKGVKIPKDSRFMLQSELMTVSINIFRGKSPEFLEPNELVQGENKDIFDTFYELSEKGDKAFTSLFTPENIKAFTLTIREMSLTIEELRKMIFENRQSLTVTMKNLQQTSSQINSLFLDNRDGIREVVRQLTTSGKSFERLVNQTDSLLSDFGRITDRVEKGEGAVGKLISEDQFYTDIMELSGNMRMLSGNLDRLTTKAETLVVHTDSLISDFKKNPRRYVKLSIF